ncbi:hypothetical protein C1H46_036495 [Malus baccata]|uniref:WHEP-TRS domain-containing protein n=1 Tax=Malus baccata TaxID=106549 RepID=A0A540KVE6_MALBA|nr:hypothetical protein C1H46_036495 [Malus baccata]
MAEDSIRKALADKQSEVDNQGKQVRAMKADKASKSEIDGAIEALNALKLEKASIEKDLQPTLCSGEGSGNKEAFRQAVSNTLERRLFYIKSFNIYGGVAGLYDYGPPGCAVKSNVLAFWRQHFVLEENMLEVDCPCVTPEVVLKASGHVEKFTDILWPSKAADQQLNVFGFPPLVAPIKCTVFPLVQNHQYEDVAEEISKSLTAAGISHKIDITGTSIGKRYARTDELGVPFAITVDSTSSVTLRERDSKDQIRVDVKEAASVVKDVAEGVRSWADVWETFPHHSSASADE